MTDARPHLSKTELAYALREMKGFSADLKTKNGYEASAALIFEIMADPVQRDQLVHCWSSLMKAIQNSWMLTG